MEFKFNVGSEGGTYTEAPWPIIQPATDQRTKLPKTCTCTACIHVFDKQTANSEAKDEAVAKMLRSCVPSCNRGSPIDRSVSGTSAQAGKDALVVHVSMCFHGSDIGLHVRAGTHTDINPAISPSLPSLSVQAALSMCTHPQLWNHKRKKCEWVGARLGLYRARCRYRSSLLTPLQKGPRKTALPHHMVQNFKVTPGVCGAAQPALGSTASGLLVYLKEGSNYLLYWGKPQCQLHIGVKTRIDRQNVASEVHPSWQLGFIHTYTSSKTLHLCVCMSSCPCEVYVTRTVLKGP